jgi:hypothetical protein
MEAPSTSRLASKLTTAQDMDRHVQHVDGSDSADARAMSKIWSTLAGMSSRVQTLLMSEGGSVQSDTISVVAQVMDDSVQTAMEDVYGLVQSIGTLKEAMKRLKEERERRSLELNEMKNETVALKHRLAEADAQHAQMKRQLDRRMEMTDQLRDTFLKQTLVVEQERALANESRDLRDKNEALSRELSKLKMERTQHVEDSAMKERDLSSMRALEAELKALLGSVCGLSLTEMITSIKSSVSADRLNMWMETPGSTAQLVQFMARIRGLDVAVTFLSTIEPAQAVAAIHERQSATSTTANGGAEARPAHTRKTSHFCGLFGQSDYDGMPIPMCVKDFLGRLMYLPKPQPWALVDLRNFLLNLYETKLAADMSDGVGHHVTLPMYLIDYCLKRYGLRTLAQRAMLSLFASIDAVLDDAIDDLRVHLFLRFCGMEAPALPLECLDYYVMMVSQVCGGSATDGGGKIRSAGGLRLVPVRRLRNKVTGANVYLKKLLLTFPPSKQKGKGKKGAKKKSKKSTKGDDSSSEPLEVDLDQFLSVVVDEWVHGDEHNLREYRHLWEANDVSQTGVLTCSQFFALLRHMHPTISDRHATVMYREAIEMCRAVQRKPEDVNDDGTSSKAADAIDGSKFAELCRKHLIGRQPVLSDRVVDDRTSNALPFRPASSFQVSQFLEAARWSTVKFDQQTVVQQDHTPEKRGY